MRLKIIKAKPNPAGKDRVRNVFTPKSQLAGEWVDIQNISSEPVNLTGVSLQHFAYTLPFSQTGKWKRVIRFNGVLKPSEVIRVHSGKQIPLSQMNPIDSVGANYHLFSNQDYVWNNKRSDHPALWYEPTKQWIDKATYNPFPIEGKILIRNMDRLI